MDGPPDVVIDLGTAPPGRPGGRWPQLRGWWRHRRRVVLPSLLGGLVLALLSGSAGPLPGRVSIPLAPDQEGEFDIIGNLAFVPESRTQWGAYDLATGQRRWVLEQPDTSREQTRSTSWSVFQAVAGAGAGVVTGHHWSTPDGLAHRFYGVDLVTGRVSWQAVPASAVRVQLVGQPPLVVSVAEDGWVQLRAPRTGAVLAGRRLPAGVGDQLIVAGDRLVVAAGATRGLGGSWSRSGPADPDPSRPGAAYPGSGAGPDQPDPDRPG